MKMNMPYSPDKVVDKLLKSEEFNVYTTIAHLPLDENPT